MNKFSILILLELIFIAFLIFYILVVKNLNQKSINPINKSQLVFLPTKKLKYYYELEPNNTTTINENWGPNKAFYTINSQSLNERFEYEILKDPKIFRIVTLGDSYTFGLYVDTKDNWTEILEDNLNNSLNCKKIERFEVINLGVGAYDIQYTVERFKRRGQQFNPNLVVWLFIDFSRINEEMLPRAQRIERELIKNNDAVRLNSYYAHAQAQKEYQLEYGYEKIINYQKMALSQFHDHYSSDLFYILPPWFTEKERNVFITDKSRSNKIEVLSILDEILLDEANLFKGDGHPNQSGHKKIANAILRYLIDSKTVSECVVISN